MLKNILHTLIVYICFNTKFAATLQNGNANIIYHRNLNNSSCTNEYCVNFNKSDNNLDNINSNSNNLNKNNHVLDYGSNPADPSASQLLFSGKNLNINREHLRRTSVIYGLISISSNDLLSDACYNDLQKIYDGIHKKEVWAMKVLDASGHQEPGFIWGNNHWIGSQKGCESATTPLSITLSDRYERVMKPNLVQALAPIGMEYRIVYAKHASAWQVEVKFLSENILHIGLCVPTSCTNGELFNLTQEYFHSRIIQAQDVFEFNAEILHVKDMKLRENFYNKKSVIIIGTITVLTLALVVLSFYVNNRNSQEANENNASGGSEAEGVKVTERTLFAILMDCYNVRQNIKTIFHTEVNQQSIPVINGIKTISCFLILAFHMQWFPFYTLHNSSVMFHYAEQIKYQLVSNAPLFVDIFFTISGFLLAYNFLRNKSRMEEVRNNSLYQNVKLFGKLLLHRYIRLSPMYLIINALGEIMTSYIVDTSKFWVHERSDLNCQRYWWRNVLYIQNLFHTDELCLCWTWSMACEMQYFFIFTIFLFIYAKNDEKCKKYFSIFALSILIMNFYVNLSNEFAPSYDVLYNTGTALYIAPWARIAPYVVGVFAGWFLNDCKGILDITKATSRIIWCVAVLMFFICLHSTMKRDIPVWFASTIIVLGRWAFSGSAAWFIIANATGHENWISRFLSAKFFVHINKLSYAIYLLNPLIITVLFGLCDSSSHADPTPAIVMTLGVTVVSYLLAVVFSLLFEIPYCILSTEILKIQSMRKKLQMAADSNSNTAANNSINIVKKED